MQIVGLGTYAMDVILQVNALPAEDGFAVVTQNTKVPGGSGTNVIVQAARLGADCGYLAKIGDDGFGRDIQSSLREEGVDIRALKIKSGGISLHTDIVVDGEGRKFILLNMGDAFGAYAAEEVDLSYLKRAAVFYTDLLPGGAALHGLAQAKRAGLKTAFNLQVNLPTMNGLGVSTEVLLGCLQQVDLFAPCREGVYQLCGTSDHEGCLRFLRPYFKGTLLLTLGSEGAVSFDEADRKVVVPSRPIRPVDTTGAGDAFMGGMVAAYLLEGQPLEQAMKFSTICAAETCLKLGARSGPNRSTVEALLKEWHDEQSTEK